MRPAIITLTTDFGTTDHYVGEMKGVILSMAPRAAIVDITHEIPAHDVMEAGWVLRHACGAFPRGSVHVAVVDPGVGTSRRPIIAKAAGRWFVGPDNGIFAWVFAEHPPSEIRLLTSARRISATFHGRDLFAPAAARLASGKAAASLGPKIKRWLRLEIPRPEKLRRGRMRATVIHVDRFGNVILNLTREEIAAMGGLARGARMTLLAGRRRVSHHVRTYAQIPAGGVATLINSAGHLELAANCARADRKLGVARGKTIDMRIE